MLGIGTPLQVLFIISQAAAPGATTEETSFRESISYSFQPISISAVAAQRKALSCPDGQALDWAA